jgi:hypothetical protein
VNAVANLARGLALNRVVFGLGFVAAPKLGAKVWIGRAASKDSVTILTRALGIRDAVLAGGALWALRDGGAAARPWFAAQAVADATDLAATVAVRDEIPQTAFRVTVGMASASAVVGLLAATSAD